MFFGRATLGDGDRHHVANDAGDVLEAVGIELGCWHRTLHEAARSFAERERQRIVTLAVALMREPTMTGARALEVAGRPGPPDLSALHRALEFFAARRARAGVAP